MRPCLLNRHHRQLLADDANNPQSQKKDTADVDTAGGGGGEANKDIPKMDPRVLNLDLVKSLVREGAPFECRICGRQGQ